MIKLITIIMSLFVVHTNAYYGRNIVPELTFTSEQIPNYRCEYCNYQLYLLLHPEVCSNCQIQQQNFIISKLSTTARTVQSALKGIIKIVSPMKWTRPSFDKRMHDSLWNKDLNKCSRGKEGNCSTKSPASSEIHNVIIIKQDETSKMEQSSVTEEFIESLVSWERLFFTTCHKKLLANSPPDRREHGISFVVSSLWLNLILWVLSDAVSPQAATQIAHATNFSKSQEETASVLQWITSSLPKSTSSLHYRFSTHLFLGEGVTVSDSFADKALLAVGMKVHNVAKLNDTQLVEMMNNMVHDDTHGAMRHNFDLIDVEGGVGALLLSTVYFRNEWRGNVTLLEGETDFRDSPTGPYRRTRMFRINDVMRYARIPEWDAEVVEIPYATPNMSVTLVIASSSDRVQSVVQQATAAGHAWLSRQLRTSRVEVTMPLYTLRMTLLLPNKLQEMGITDMLQEPLQTKQSGGLKLTHALQRLMFWSETGRNAYKDDGIKWDATPEHEILVDRPYMLLVKFDQVVIMSGIFVL